MRFRTGDSCADGSCTPEPYVKITDRGNIWITLPGDVVSHMLTPGDARKLLRELEAAV